MCTDTWDYMVELYGQLREIYGYGEEHFSGMFGVKDFSTPLHLELPTCIGVMSLSLYHPFTVYDSVNLLL